MQRQKGNNFRGKRKPDPVAFPAAGDRDGQTLRLVALMSRYTTHVVTCAACGAEDACPDLSAVGYARDLQSSGWRCGTHPDGAGILCPACAKAAG